jgi:transcriptional regulator with XRE-family HTH domain
MSYTGTLLRQKREAANLSQTDICGKIGWKNGQYISNIERGLCQVPVKHINQLAVELGIGATEIVDAMILDYKEKIVSEIFNNIAKRENNAT